MRDERGTTTLLIVGLALVLMMMAAVVTDASAAYLQRQGLDTIADGAALSAADAGASGSDSYGGGLDDALHLDADAARIAVAAYLRRVDALGRYPGLTASVTVDAVSQRVVVAVRALVRLPLHVPGSPSHAEVGATGSARVGVDR